MKDLRTPCSWFTIGLFWLALLGIAPGCTIGPVRLLSWEPRPPQPQTTPVQHETAQPISPSAQSPAGEPLATGIPAVEPAPAAAPKTSPEPARTETTGSTASSEEEEIAKLGPAERAARRGEALPQAPAQQPLPPAPKKEDGPFPEGPFAPVVIENSLFQPTYLGSAWLESLHLQIDDRGDSLGFRWTNQTGMTLDFTLSNPFQIHVRDLAGTWEIDCMAAWRAGYVDYLLLGPADANRACIVSPQNPPLSKLRIGTDVCTLQSAGEVEVSIPGTPLVSRGRVSVLVGRD